MLDIFKWECTTNETCQGHFLWKYCILIKKKNASPEKSTSSDEKE